MSMLNIGITGGIGSGKSTVGKIFSSLGYRLYHADARAKALMTDNPRVVQQVKDLFGEETYFDDGTLNRALLGKIVFQDSSKLAQLNAIVHPETARDYVEWVQETPADYGKTFVLKEAAILYESGASAYSDAVITVYAPTATRLSRVMNRDKVDRQTVLARMNKQWPEIKKVHQAEFMIINDGKHALIPQVLAAITYFNQSSS